MPPPSSPSLGNLTKILLPLVAAVVGFGVGLFLYLGKAQEVSQLQQQLAMSRQQAAQMEAKNQELTQQIGGLQSERKNLDDKITSLRSQLSSATAELERSRQSLKDSEDRYQQLTEERSKLETRVAEVLVEREEARKRADRLAQEKAELERAASRARERLTLLDRDYRKLSEQLAQMQAASVPTTGLVTTLPPANPAVVPSLEGTAANPTATTSAIPGAVELPPIVVRKDQTAASSSVRGRLVEVDESHNFVVVDKGSTDGVRAGMTFDILRGSSTVGRATVIRVRPQLSACDIVQAHTPGPLQVGDLAVQAGL